MFNILISLGFILIYINSLQGQRGNDILLYKLLRELNYFQQKFLNIIQYWFKSYASYQQHKNRFIPEALSLWILKLAGAVLLDVTAHFRTTLFQILVLYFMLLPSLNMRGFSPLVPTQMKSTLYDRTQIIFNSLLNDSKNCHFLKKKITIIPANYSSPLLFLISRNYLPAVVCMQISFISPSPASVGTCSTWVAYHY